MERKKYIHICTHTHLIIICLFFHMLSGLRNVLYSLLSLNFHINNREDYTLTKSLSFSYPCFKLRGIKFSNNNSKLLKAHIVWEHTILSFQITWKAVLLNIFWQHLPIILAQENHNNQKILYTETPFCTILLFLFIINIAPFLLKSPLILIKTYKAIVFHN